MAEIPRGPRPAVRERYGVSYITVAQRHLDEFAPVVAALAGT